MFESFIYYLSPMGQMALASDGTFLTRAAFCPVSWTQELPYRENIVLKQACRQLKAYFAGESCRFEVPLRPSGTPFQLVVWECLRQIPYGATWSYKDLARAAGNEKAARAVGKASHFNPLVIFIPCHRVIGANGALTGYAGGMEKKAFLLQLEKRFGAEK